VIITVDAYSVFEMCIRLLLTQFPAGKLFYLVWRVDSYLEMCEITYYAVSYFLWIQVNGHSVAGMTQRDAVDLIRTSGNVINITALRQVYSSSHNYFYHFIRLHLQHHGSIIKKRKE
jgi:hypothetical protein